MNNQELVAWNAGIDTNDARRLRSRRLVFEDQRREATAEGERVVLGSKLNKVNDARQGSHARMSDRLARQVVGILVHPHDLDEDAPAIGQPQNEVRMAIHSLVNLLREERLLELYGDLGAVLRCPVVDLPK